MNAALRCREKVDMRVLAGEKARLPARLIAIELNEEVANGRRRKRNRYRKTNPDKRDLELLGWQIMLTNCDGELLPIGKAREIYLMQWRIETIFKTWGSGLDIEKFASRGSARMAEAIVQSSLLRVALIHAVSHSLAGGSRTDSQGQRGEAMGLISLSSSFIGEDAEANENILEGLSKHCRYDKRKIKKTLEKWDLLVSQIEELR